MQQAKKSTIQNSHPAFLHEKPLKPINLRASELSNGLGTLRDGVFSQLTRKNKAHRRLDLPRGDSRLLVVASEL
uniref:Uncharacterized protein n=1 Tax=Cucumis melo TaxID=3656 RepID=A0A9I9ELQ4_CUCME